MSAEAVRFAAVIALAVGLVLMLTPAALAARVRLPDRTRRIAGLAVVLAGWVVMAGTLLPDPVTDRLSEPVGMAVGIGGVLIVLAALVLVGRVIARRPWVWFVLLGLTLPVRIPISLGNEDANLLLPLYAVIVVGLSVLWWMERDGTRLRRWPTTPLDLPLMLFTGFTVVSLLWSSDVTEGAIKLTFFWIPFTLLFLIVVALWREGRAFRTLTITTVAMSVPVALLALGEYAAREVLWNHRLMQANVYSRFFRVNSIFYDPNILGRYLVLALLFTVALAWLWRANGRVLVACAVVATVDALAFVVTFSRSSALMLMVGLLIMALRLFGWRRVLLTAAIMAVAGGGAAVAASGHVRAALTSTDRLEKVSEGRFDLVGGGVDIFRQHPVVGGGVGSFATDYSALLTEDEIRRTRVVISHNAPVTVLSEEGAVGFALFVWLCVIAGLVGIRATRNPDEGIGVPAARLLAGLAGIFVHALLYAALFEDPFTWVLAAGLVALAATPSTAGSTAGTSTAGSTAGTSLRSGTEEVR